MRKVLYLTLLVLVLGLSGWAQPVRVVNANAPGELFELKQALDKSRTNVVVFSSARSEPAQRLLQTLRELGGADDRLAVRVLDIDRTTASTIDWRSPLAQQYNIKVVPYVLILDREGNKLWQGQEARKELLRRLDLVRSEKKAGS